MLIFIVSWLLDCDLPGLALIGSYGLAPTILKIYQKYSYRATANIVIQEVASLVKQTPLTRGVPGSNLINYFEHDPLSASRKI